MKTQMRIVLSIITIIFWLSADVVFNTAQGPIQGKAAVQQLNGGDAEYTAARAAATTNMIPMMITIIALLVLAALWFTPFVRAVRTKQSNQGGDTMNRSTMILLASLIALSSAACGPAKLEKIEEIGPSETAFLIQLEGDTLNGQDTFKSIEFLEKQKVAVKRISLPQRKIDTGRAPWAYKYIPTATVIKVDRKPVTREWVKGDKQDMLIYVESKDSIGFGVGVSLTASIPEDMASTFLYNYSGKPLSAVLDENVRGFVQTVLSREFGERPLSRGRDEKREIFEVTLRETKEIFKGKGFSIDYLGLSEGLTYENPKIQEAIDAVFQAERDVQRATQEKLAQDERNKMNVGKAEAERLAAQEFAKAKDAAVAKMELDISMVNAQAKLKAADKWNGQVPANILPQGSDLLFGLDKPSGKN